MLGEGRLYWGRGSLDEKIQVELQGWVYSHPRQDEKRNLGSWAIQKYIA